MSKTTVVSVRLNEETMKFLKEYKDKFHAEHQFEINNSGIVQVALNKFMESEKGLSD